MGGGSGRWKVAGAAVVAVVAAVAGAVAVLGGSDGEEAIRLEPIGTSFEGDFAADLDLLGPGSSLALALPDVPPLGASLAGALAGLRGADGDQPGLYGGSRSVGTCDVDQLVGFLTDPANEAKAAAWAEVLGIEVDDIETFARGLTPLRLRFDTAVTNHGFRDGRANPIPSVLEAGTAVLVDDRGVPRVKCACGNPLAPPAFDADAVASAAGARPWRGFDPDRIVAVTAGSEVARFVGLDVDDGTLFARPAGTNGEADLPVPASAALCDVFGDSPTCSGRGLGRDVAMPDVAGSTVQAAADALAALGFVRQPTVTEEPSDDVPAGIVLRSEPPAGRVVPVKSPVTLVVSSGPEGAPSTTSSSTSTSSSSTTTTVADVVVPDVAGLPQSDAQATLADAGLGSSVTFVPSDDVPAGLVVGTDPPAGSVVPGGSTVDLFVSSGPDVVVVPDVIGMTADEAEQTLAAAGLATAFQSDQGAPAELEGTVTGQDPEGGTEVLRGSTVTVLVASAPG